MRSAFTPNNIDVSRLSCAADPDSLPVCIPAGQRRNGAGHGLRGGAHSLQRPRANMHRMPPTGRLAAMLPGARFPNLDGLRFLAAALVILDHLQQHAHNMGLPWLGSLSHWDMLGHLGVLMFFVLSGFLITYLLLDEECRTGRIHYGRFQMRRILRIWPIYFLLVGLALFVFPHIPQMAMPGVGQEEVMQGRPRKLALYALFLPTLVPWLAGAVPHLGHLWTLGSEVHFYLAWPLLIMAFRRWRWLPMLLVIPLHSAGMRLLGGMPNAGLLSLYWSQLNIDIFAIGGLAAWLAFHRRAWLRWAVNVPVFAVVALGLMVLMRYGVFAPWVNYRFYALLFALLILNLALEPRLARVLEWPPMQYLGRISYGVYVYHMAAMVLVINILLPLGLARRAIMYPLVYGATIAVAAVSFGYFEGFFQRFRRRFPRLPIKE